MKVVKTLKNKKRHKLRLS